MFHHRRLSAYSIVALLLVTVILAGCGATATPTAEPTKVAAPTSAPAVATAKPTVAPTSAPPTVAATAAPKAAAVGGSFTLAMPADADSLDPATTSSAYSEMITALIGGGPLIVDPTGKIVGYHVDKWKVSDDGLSVDFTLKKGIKFQDGTPLTAKDYVYTWNRIKDPATKAGVSASVLEPVTSIEVVDDLTFRLKLAQPYFSMLFNIAADRGVLIPLSEAWVKKVGDQVARQGMSAGPFKFKEWKTGDRIVLERNPDFTWGPSFLNNGGAPYFDTIQIRFITEYETIVAGLEAGEIDLAAFQPKDLARIQGVKTLKSMDAVSGGLFPYVSINLTKAPFDDVRVRKALNLAVDRDALVKVALQGQGIPQYGPISPATIGYWSGVEKIGYHLDLAQAKDLMKQAGYAAGSDGMLQKDGKPLRMILITPTDPNWYGPVEALQQQWKALGVDVKIEVKDKGIVIEEITAETPTYDLSTMGWVTVEADGLFTLWHSTGFNPGHVKDAELDKILESTRTATDAAKRQEFVNQAQQRIVEQAYCIPLYARRAFAALNTRVKGMVADPNNAAYHVYLEAGWVVEK
jgi:peptide/nickel transport system substrate-binding protein